MQLESAIYRVIHKRRNITVYFAGHPEFLQITEFYIYTLAEQWQIKIKKLESEHYTVRKCYIQDAPQKKQCHSFFRGAPKFKK